MATRCRIGIAQPQFSPTAQTLNPERDVLQIYCHNGGGIDDTGVLLFVYYKTVKQVNDLIKLGHISSLGYCIGKKHSFEKRISDIHYYDSVKYMTLAYHRDRGEKLEVDKVKIQDLGEGITYLFVPELEKWFVRIGNAEYRPLGMEIIANVFNLDRTEEITSHYVDPKDTEALNDLHSFFNSIRLYKRNENIVPNYEYVVDENNSRQYLNSLYPNTAYSIIHIEKIWKDRVKKCKQVTYTINKGANQTVSLFEFFEKWIPNGHCYLNKRWAFRLHLINFWWF